MTRLSTSEPAGKSDRGIGGGRWQSRGGSRGWIHQSTNQPTNGMCQWVSESVVEMGQMNGSTEWVVVVVNERFRMTAIKKRRERGSAMDWAGQSTNSGAEWVGGWVDLDPRTASTIKMYRQPLNPHGWTDGSVKSMIGYVVVKISALTYLW